jgi:hypothetical protein
MNAAISQHRRSSVDASHQERRYLMHAAIPRSRRMTRRSQTRPIPHIIPIGMSVIRIMFKQPFLVRAFSSSEEARQPPSLCPTGHAVDYRA